MEQISWDDFSRVKLRVGTIIKTEEFPEASKPAYYNQQIDFGNEIGIKNQAPRLQM